MYYNKSLLGKKNCNNKKVLIYFCGFIIICWILFFMDFVIKLIYDKMLIEVYFLK